MCRMTNINESTDIDGFVVTLTINDEGSSCFISQGECNSSLTLAEAFGHIEDTSQRVDPIEIDPRTLTKIRTWAERYGY
jgi:hypothetical protein